MKYTKFTHEMDVFLLESMQSTNPLLAPHGTRLAAWKELASQLGRKVCNNAEACTWQICRDRAKALLHMHEHGQEKKLYKNSSSQQENKRKEELLIALRKSIPEKTFLALKKVSPNKKLKTAHAMPASAVVLQPLRPLPRQENAQPNTQPLLSSVLNALKTESSLSKGMNENSRKRKEMHEEPQNELKEMNRVIERSIQLDVEMREKDTRIRHEELDLHEKLIEYLNTNINNISSKFQHKLLQLIERKLSFDMEQRKKDIELRQEELAVQRKLLQLLTKDE
ncbi:hypothetical protein THRCLA_01541 [Thraustotheca clavata]|uniref:Uncharacterized protein n=1 Tax=Thraustotheca clavata TaxID=74557 RepID=A0A1W0A7Z5_9STRA|nr:hypothetical protein THRCLA_01541 [Thraustotheca clavata]